MSHATKHRKQGFTLIELAIVLTIAGLLFVGLWRLLAGGNAQIRDQSVGNEQQQIISAVKAYLGSGQPAIDGFWATLPTNGNGTLALPTSNTSLANCQGNITASNKGLCSFLPSGFTSATPNAYGQTYTVRVARNDATASPNPPTVYSFMIVTTGGDVIADASGGRISAAIGNDGGFIYSNQVCGNPAAQMACGAYGTWSTNAVTTFGFGGTTGGHVASRTFVSPSSDNLFPWLERNTSIQPDPTFGWNTMTTNLYMGPIPLGGGQSNIYLSQYFNNVGAPFDATYKNYQGTGGGNFYMQGGVIEGGGTSNISLTADTSTAVPPINITASAVPTAFLPGLINALVNTCTMTAPGVPGNCPYAIAASTISAANLVNANAFYALNFNYTASDIRFKTNIQPVVDALDNIMKLKPVSYTLKSSGKDSLGVIAQDLEKVYPELVTKGEGMKYVNYDGLIAPLIGAVQELKAQNDDLRRQLHEQEQRQDAIEREVKGLKNRP